MILKYSKKDFLNFNLIILDDDGSDDNLSIILDKKNKK
jgi:glycosyltransferase involved in cell wall biosynthesis